MLKSKTQIAISLVLQISMMGTAIAQRAVEAEVHAVVELSFAGPQQGAKDSPARDVDFWVRFKHESGAPEYRVYGFWDGDGKGGAAGNVFKVRFTPTKPGRWILAEVHSNAKVLAKQRQGESLIARRSDRRGFWLLDEASAGGRWYKRSDGSHQYIIGNTQYSFLSGYREENKASGVEIAADVTNNARYFKKLRFTFHGDRYPHPQEKPFLDDDGRPTDSGDYSHRPNPKWFHERGDVAVRAAFDHDLIADLILCGPDTVDSRATLRAGRNNGDPTPYLKYIAARYGSYPNVWVCLCNEYEIKEPSYTETQIARFGQIIRQHLPYPTPLSNHSHPRTLWSRAFDELPPWNDHQIIQKKIRVLPDAADVIQGVWKNEGGKGTRNKPTANDELSYQGEGDKHSEGDTIESHLGTFLGGGYGTTGWKPGNKLGHYFYGGFNPAEHTAADNLKWLREVIDANISFWQMAPDLSIFENLDPGFRGLAWPGNEFALGTNKAHRGIVARLPAGKWAVTMYDVINLKTTALSTNATGNFTFDAPESRATLFHFKRAGSRKETPR
jgi:Domain of unknown function (DUF5060)/Protein of unknown function (DUF4038)